MGTGGRDLLFARKWAEHCMQKSKKSHLLQVYFWWLLSCIFLLLLDWGLTWYLKLFPSTWLRSPDLEKYYWLSSSFIIILYPDFRYIWRSTNSKVQRYSSLSASLDQSIDREQSARGNRVVIISFSGRYISTGIRTPMMLGWCLIPGN